MTNSVMTSLNGEFCVLFSLRVLCSLESVLAIYFLFYCITLLYREINSYIFMCYQKWKDHRLTWNVSDFENITSIYVPTDMIWVPDIVLVNEYVHM